MKAMVLRSAKHRPGQVGNRGNPLSAVHDIGEASEVDSQLWDWGKSNCVIAERRGLRCVTHCCQCRAGPRDPNIWAAGDLYAASYVGVDKLRGAKRNGSAEGGGHEHDGAARGTTCKAWSGQIKFDVKLRSRG